MPRLLGDALGERRGEDAVAGACPAPFGFAAGAGCGAGAARSLRLGVLRRAAAGAASAFGARRRSGGAAGGRSRDALRILALAGDQRDELVHRHVGRAFRHHDLGEDAFVDGLDFHGRLVGLDLGDHVAGLDRVALLLQPLGEVALLHGGRQGGHQDIDGHGVDGS